MELLLEGSKTEIGGRAKKKTKTQKQKKVKDKQKQRKRKAKSQGGESLEGCQERECVTDVPPLLRGGCDRLTGNALQTLHAEAPEVLVSLKSPNGQEQLHYRLCVSVTLLTAAQALPDTQQKLTNNWLWIRTHFLTLKPVRFKVRTSIRLPPGHLAFSKSPVNILRMIVLPVYFVIQQMTLNDLIQKDKV